MGHNSSKVYYEYLAKLILEAFAPWKYHDLVCGDKPDLRMDDKHGIEVSRAMFEGYGKAGDIFDRVKNKHIGEIDKRDLDKLNNLGYEVYAFENGIIWGKGRIEGGSEIDGKEFKDIYLKKIQKASQYSNIEVLDLFIYSPMISWYEENIFRELTEWINENGDCPFDTIILFETNYLYMYDVGNREIQKVAVKKTSPELLDECRQKAYAYAFNEA